MLTHYVIKPYTAKCHSLLKLIIHESSYLSAHLIKELKVLTQGDNVKSINLAREFIDYICWRISGRQWLIKLYFFPIDKHVLKKFHLGYSPD